MLYTQFPLFHLRCKEITIRKTFTLYGQKRFLGQQLNYTVKHLQLLLHSNFSVFIEYLCSYQRQCSKISLYKYKSLFYMKAVWWLCNKSSRFITVKKNILVNATISELKIQYRTLRYHLNKDKTLSNTLGRKSTLIPEEENKLC